MKPVFSIVCLFSFFNVGESGVVSEISVLY